MLLYVLGILGLGAVGLIGGTVVTAISNSIKAKRNASFASDDENTENKNKDKSLAKNKEKIKEEEKTSEKVVEKEKTPTKRKTKEIVSETENKNEDKSLTKNKEKTSKKVAEKEKSPTKGKTKEIVSEKVNDSKSITAIVNEKMNSDEVKKLVGKNEEKAKYLRVFLTNAATKQHDNGKSVEELMNHKTMNGTLIPRACARIDKFLSLKKKTAEQFVTFDKNSNEKYVKEQKVSIAMKMKTLEKEMIENSKSFDSSAENFEADLLKTISDMKKGKHITGLMKDVADLQKGSTATNEKIEMILEELEKHGYDLKQLEALGLVEMSQDVEKNKRIIVDIYNKVRNFEQKFGKYDNDFNKILEELEKHGYDLKQLEALGLVEMSQDVEKNKRIIVDVYNRMQNVEQRLENHDYDFKMLEKLDLVGLKDKVNELVAKNSINEEDAKVIYATCINNYIESEQFKQKVQEIIGKTEITVSERMAKNARKKLIKELYDTIINDGELDQKKLKETIDGTVKDIIENRLSVKKGKN